VDAGNQRLASYLGRPARINPGAIELEEVKVVYMAKTINRITAAAPTSFAAALNTGGSLLVGTTYYYRVLTVRKETGPLFAISVPTAEQSVTPTVGNQTANLSWTAAANAWGYIVQRTTTSGSYPVGSGNSLQIQGGYGVNYPTVTTLTSITDDGGVSNVRFNALNLDLSRLWPVIEIYGSANDLITLNDIRLADVAGGWGDLAINASAGLAAYTNATWVDEAPYLLQGSLYVHDCQFRLRSVLSIINGSFYADPVTATLLFGSATAYYTPQILYMSPRVFCYTTNNSTQAGYYYTNLAVGGKDNNSLVKNFICRVLTYTSIYPYWSSAFSQTGMAADTVYEDCHMGRGGGGSGVSFSVPSKYMSRVILEGLTPAADLKDFEVKGTNILMNYAMSIFRATVNYVSATAYDIQIGGTVGHAFEDCTFKARGQTDNKPAYYYYTTNLNAAVIFRNSFKLRVCDVAGSPINGCVVTLVNALGNSAFFEDTLTTFYAALNSTDSSSTLTVGDSTKLAVNDVIKLEPYSELLRVSAIINATSVTVERGYLGTAKRATINRYTSNRVLRKIASLTTDVNGFVQPTEGILVREVHSISASGYKTDTEDNLVSAGYLGRTYYTPHTLAITKAGYQDYQEVITIDRKMDLEVALSTPIGGVSPTNLGLVPLGIKQVSI
jgi:hypothetical protein